MAGALGSGACQRHVSDSALCTCSRAAVMADVSVTDCGSCHANARLTLQPPPRPRGLRSNLLMIAEMINKFHRKLFSQIIHPGHCLYQLLPSKTSAHCRYSLRLLEKDNTPFNYPNLNYRSLKQFHQLMPI